jgi:hypothetical protein
MLATTQRRRDYAPLDIAKLLGATRPFIEQGRGRPAGPRREERASRATARVRGDACATPFRGTTPDTEAAQCDFSQPTNYSASSTATSASTSLAPPIGPRTIPPGSDSPELPPLVLTTPAPSARGSSARPANPHRWTSAAARTAQARGVHNRRDRRRQLTLALVLLDVDVVELDEGGVLW